MKKHKFTVEMDPNLYLRLRQIVAERGSTVDEMITVAVMGLKTREERDEALYQARLDHARKNGYLGSIWPD